MNGGDYRHGLGFLRARLETPGLDGLNGIFIETEARSPNDTYIYGLTVFTHHKPRHNCGLHPCISSLVGVFRISLRNDCWRLDTFSHDKRSTTLRRWAGSVLCQHTDQKEY